MNLIWTDIIKKSSTKDFIALYYSQNVAILLPRRQISDNIEKIEDLIKRFYLNIN